MTEEERFEAACSTSDSVAVAVLTLHTQRSFCGDGGTWDLCCECRQWWPCATAEAVYETLGVA